MDKPSQALIRAAQTLNHCLAGLEFGDPVDTVYNPLEYAWNAYRRYLECFTGSGSGSKSVRSKRVLLLGMNPGPWGMAQTGVPFGEIKAVRDWMGIQETISRPQVEHPRRPVTGFDTTRSEVSGKRLWGLAQQRFGRAEDFFADHFVGNYCPLVFFDTGGRNITPEKLRSRDREALYRCCDEHLREMIRILDPEWLIGIGRFTEQRLRTVIRGTSRAGTGSAGIGEPGGRERTVAGILHPSPASPAANQDWAGRTTERLISLGVW
jgi:single-strand selective monofunctional uracil DNA glycosylase